MLFFRMWKLVFVENKPTGFDFRSFTLLEARHLHFGAMLSLMKQYSLVNDDASQAYT